MFRSYARVLLLLSISGGALITSGTASAACVARPLVLLHPSSGSGRTAVKLPAFLRATLICGEERGLRGRKGAVGRTGAPGANGANGIQGLPGTPGTNGTNGVQGLPGIPGTNGTNGIDGAVGPARTPDYAYLYDALGQTVPASGDVHYTVHGPMTSEFAHTVGGAAITFETGGTFKVGLAVSGAGRNQVALTLDGVAVAGSLYGSDDNSEQNTGQTIVTVAAGQVLTVRNQSATAAIVLDNTAGGSALNVDASILIERLA